MKIILIILSVTFIHLLGNNLYCQIQLTGKDSQYERNFFIFSENLESNASEHFDKIKGSKPLRRWQNHWSKRIKQDGTLPSSFDIYKQYKEFRGKSSEYSTLSTNKWEEFGPRSPQIGFNLQMSGSGRINCIAFPSDDKETIWAGSAAGGLWKSTDRGDSWEVEPFTEFLSMGVSDIAISESNPEIIYVATGDVDGGSFFGGYSLGIIKSTDGGNNWEVLNLGFDYSNGEFVSKIIVSSANPNYIIASTSYGIIKSIDGGYRWELIFGGYNIRDLMFKPGDEQTIYATSYSINSGASIFKSEDSGDTWYIIKHYQDANRIKLAVTPLDPEFLLAVATDYRSNSFLSLHLSRSSGIAWEKLLDDNENYSFLVQAQGFFNLVLEFSPENKNDYFVGGVWLYKGNINQNMFYAAPAMIHVDMHDMKYNKHDGKMYSANDGGIYRFDVNFENVENISNNLGITQFYRIGLNPININNFYAGSQDNNMFNYFYDSWNFYWGGDGMESFVDPRNPSLVYYSTQRGVLYSSELGMLWINTNERRPWVTSFLYHPTSPDKIFCGYENVWYSSNRGADWQNISDFKDNLTITSIALSTMDSNKIFAANSRNLYKTDDFGNNWELVYSSDYYISDLRLDNFDNLWISIARFGRDEKVFRYINGNIENHTYNLPNMPVNCIEIDSINQKIFIGTDLGVFEKGFDDNRWSIAGESMPAVIVNDMEIHYGSGTLFAATFGRGIWTLNLFDCYAEAPIIELPESRLFCPYDSLTLKVAEPADNYRYIWSDGSEGIEKIIKETGTYYVSAISPNNCTAASDTIYIRKISPINVSLVLAGNNPICQGDTAKINAYYSPFASIKSAKWSDSTEGSFGRFINAGDYFFILEDEFGCVYCSDTISIKVNPLPEKPIITKNGYTLKASSGDFFRWYRNGKLLNDFTGETCHIYETGSYMVMVRDTNFCFNFSDEFLVDLGSSDSKSFSYILYPNPSSSIVTLEMDVAEESDIEIELFDTLGKRLYSKKYEQRNGYFLTLIDISKFANAAYYLHIRNNKSKVIEKIIKQ